LFLRNIKLASAKCKAENYLKMDSVTNNDSILHEITAIETNDSRMRRL